MCFDVSAYTLIVNVNNYLYQYFTRHTSEEQCKKGCEEIYTIACKQYKEIFTLESSYSKKYITSHYPSVNQDSL